MTTIHLRSRIQFRDQQDLNQSQLVISKFIEACISQDASIFEPYMQEDDVFEDKEKYLFLAQLKDLFSEIKSEMPVPYYVAVRDSECCGCPEGKGKLVKHFELKHRLSNKVLDGFAFIIDTENGILKDIFRCYDYAGCLKVDLGGDDLPIITISRDVWKKMKKDILE
ncbi:MAG TPA: hypothetical protein PK951_01115 [Chitinophagaceae bacterium]|nr:hypothetical protein [Chitinophagaceae bacterium]